MAINFRRPVRALRTVISRQARIAAVLAVSAFALPAAAQGYPDRPVRFIVPFSAGGSTDVTARTLGEAMAKDLGQTIIVENRPGAAGTLGAALVAKAAPDGYTVLVGGVGPIMVVPELDPSLPYRPSKDFEAIGQITNNDYGWVVSAGSPLRTAADLVDTARQRPGQLSYMTTGVGGPLHVSMEYFAKREGLSMNHIPYQGESQAMGDLLANRLDVAVMSLTVAAPQIKAGKVRMISLLSAQRSTLMPDIPTLAEGGFPGYEIPVWLGLFVPAGTPAPAVEKLAAAMQKSLRQPAFQARMRDLGAEPVGGARDQYLAFLKSESARWKTRAAETGVSR
ncbi:Bug family tripartite tricarboxylate transporter substrate binding protein [Achromobacter sp. NPDC058515]|uniref:Bug family tripartite tricarboxylate transporter substrate binding protein n=1 Tax=Achromobacter sp. NPDC058515 TaxID=3346533 RepID=UPI003649B4D8